MKLQQYNPELTLEGWEDVPLDTLQAIQYLNTYGSLFLVKHDTVVVEIMLHYGQYVIQAFGNHIKSEISFTSEEDAIAYAIEIAQNWVA